MFLWSTNVRKLLNLTQQWKVGQVHGSEGNSEPLHRRPCFLWLESLTGLTYLCTELVFSLEFYTYEWWTKQNSFMFFLPSVAFFFSSCFFENEVTYCRQVSTYPPCAWPPELISSHIPWWFYRDWKLGSRVCYARELIKIFIAGGKLIYSSLFVLYFNHLSQSQKSNCLLHISNRCWGVKGVTRILSNKMLAL